MNPLRSLMRAIRGVPVAAAPPSPRRTRASLLLDDRQTPTEPQGWGHLMPAKPTPNYVRGVLDQALAGDLGMQAEMMAMMLDTWPRLRKNLHELRSGAARARYSVNPAMPAGGTEATPAAMDRADLVRQMISNWGPAPGSDESGFEDTLYDLADALGSGLSVVEVLWEEAWRSDGRMVIRPRAGVWVPPRYLGYGNDGRLIQRTRQDGGGLRIEGEKWLVGRHKSASGPAAGYGLLRPLAWWWCAAQWGRDWLLNYAQVFGQPIRWAEYEPGMDPQHLAVLDEMLEHMAASSWGRFPAGVKLTLVEAKGTAADNPQRVIIEMADTVCDILLLGQTLTTDVGDSGSRALGDVHADVRRERVQQLAQWLADVLNYQLVPAICRLNYGDSEDCPVVSPDFTAPPDPDKLAARLHLMVNVGMRVPLAWAHEQLGVPIPEGDEPVLQSPAKPASPDAEEEEEDEEEETTPPAQARRAGGDEPLTLPRALEEMIPAAVARATRARVRWLEPLGETMDQLIQAVREERLDDDALAQFLEASAQTLPDLFARLDVEALEDALEDALGAAVMTAVRQRR